ncbi:ATP-grasp domain-containing protein [Desulfoscipio geothermicus DSM 3669]|uniref:ATP-grasp domain-containing protein n=2 Tax=Desulfoscipio geothermicus TaxID=39060 RepID=A0A1I6E914_9FIRM|nr:ATP-grasp domain-containing protein [Desulfoscipio geothermicus DSM 3669]
MTYTGRDLILLLTNKEDLTADFVVLELQKRNIPYFRFNTEDFPYKIKAGISCRNSLVNGYIDDGKNIIDLKGVKSIWYRRPKRAVPGENINNEFERFCRMESWYFLRGLWENIDCFWVSHPYNLEKARSKIRQLAVAQQIGLKIPDTLVSNNPSEVKRFFEELKGEMVVKPVRSGLVRGDVKDYVIYTSKVSVEHLEKLDGLKFAPSIFQACIPKKYDIRVTVIGEKVFPVEIHSQSNPEAVIDWRKPQDVKLEHRVHDLPVEIKTKCLQLVKFYGIQFAAIDLVLSRDGKYYFLELNPNGQWAWIEQRTGIPLTESLVDLLVNLDSDACK